MLYMFIQEATTYYMLETYRRGSVNLFNEEIMELIDHVYNSILRAREGKSKIDCLEGVDILEYEGYTGTCTRHLYNNICSYDKFDKVRYLEIGTWYGSSSISAIYKNKLDALFIDNWSQFSGDLGVFKENIQKYLNRDTNCYFIEKDCWKVNLRSVNIKPVNVYLYDGGHSVLDHYRSLEYYYDVLDDVFIFMVDDWNWSGIRDGTMAGILKMGLHILFRHEEFVSEEDLRNMPDHNGKRTWWNGVGIFVLSKTKKYKGEGGYSEI